MLKLLDLPRYDLVIETADDPDHVTDAYIEETPNGDFVMVGQAQEVIEQYIKLLGQARVEIEEVKDRIIELEEKVAGQELDNGP